MTLPAFATVEELAARIAGGISDADEPRAQAALDDASTLIRVEAGLSWVTAGEIDFGDLDAWLQDAVKAVCLTVARRVFENPDGATSMTVGDSSMTLTNATGDVYLTANERRIIHRASGRGGTLGVVELEMGTPGWSGDSMAVLGQTEPVPFTYEPLRP